jgi:hypothetical protein
MSKYAEEVGILTHHFLENITYAGAITEYHYYSREN